MGSQAAVWKWTVRVSASPEGSGAAGDVGASPQESPGADASPGASSSASPSGGPSAAEQEAAATAAPCQDSDIAVAVAVDQDSYAAGANPQITMTITNTAAADCMRDIGSGNNEIVISSGGHHAWSSDDCDPSQTGNEQVLPAGAEAQVTVTWERKLSAPGCAGEASPAQPGAYQVEGRNGEVVSEPVRFVLQ